MKKALFGMAVGVALTATAWAGNDEAGTKEARSAIATVELGKSQGQRSAEARVVEVASDRRAMKEATPIRTSFEERWLRDREGYRDGGY